MDKIPNKYHTFYFELLIENVKEFTNPRTLGKEIHLTHFCVPNNWLYQNN